MGLEPEKSYSIREVFGFLGVKSGGWVSNPLIQIRNGLFIVIILLIYQLVEWNMNRSFCETQQIGVIFPVIFGCYTGALLTSSHLAWKNVVRWFYSSHVPTRRPGLEENFNKRFHQMDELLKPKSQTSKATHIRVLNKFLREATYTS